MKKIIAMAVAAMFAVSVSAQDCCKAGDGKCCGGCFQPTWFLNLQGGVQMPYTPGDHLKDLLSPAFSVNFGRNITPLVSARIGLEGWNSKVFNAITGDKEKFKYATASFDAMLNVSSIFSNKPYHALDFFLLGGVGANYSDMSTTNSSKWSPNLRLGAQLNWNICKAVALNLEYRADNTNDQFNGRVKSGSHDWYSSLLLGISFKFGKKAKPVVAEPVYATRIDTTWYDDTEYKMVPAEEKIERTIHYTICKASPVDETIVSEVANFVKSHKDAKVTVTGYADKGTGNAKINMKYSKQRAEAVADALRNAGVEADIINVDYKGDTVQPFAENDLNRATITVATGIGDQKTPVVTKKFRTEEVRYEVK